MKVITYSALTAKDPRFKVISDYHYRIPTEHAAKQRGRYELDQKLRPAKI